MTIVMTAILGWYVYEQFILVGTVLIGTLSMLYQYAGKMDEAVRDFTWQYSSVVKMKADMESVRDIEDAYDALVKKDDIDLTHWKKIEIHNLHFTYEDKEHEQHTLQKVYLDLTPGKKIALVGESGSGKSTLLSLLR